VRTGLQTLARDHVPGINRTSNQRDPLTTCTFRVALPPWGVPLGLAVAAVGVWLIRHDRTVGTGPLAATTRGSSEPRKPSLRCRKPASTTALPSLTQWVAYASNRRSEPTEPSPEISRCPSRPRRQHSRPTTRLSNAPHAAARPGTLQRTPAAPRPESVGRTLARRGRRPCPRAPARRRSGLPRRTVELAGSPESGAPIGYQWAPTGNDDLRLPPWARGVVKPGSAAAAGFRCRAIWLQSAGEDGPRRRTPSASSRSS
jgi:hypothetical protein